MNKIQIYGILPPPFGGISIHIKRFINYLNKNNLDFVFYQSNSNRIKKSNGTSFGAFFFKNLNFEKRIIHIHGFVHIKNQILLLILILLFRKKVIVTIHNDRFSKIYSELNTIGKVITRLFYISVTYLVAVNSNSDFLFINRSKIYVIPAFIPPDVEETDITQLPEFFHQIIKKHEFLITANAFKISFYNNEDLYGIDLSIELMKRLVSSGYKDFGFIYVIPDIGDYDYYEKMQNLVKKYNLEDNFHFYTKPVDYPAVINMCDLFIRPTNTDGDALSIREAISLKKPAIASDVCMRPEGTILFKNRDIDDLFLKTIKVVFNYDEERKKLENIEFDDNAKNILKVYKKILNESS